MMKLESGLQPEPTKQNRGNDVRSVSPDGAKRTGAHNGRDGYDMDLEWGAIEPIIDKATIGRGMEAESQSGGRVLAVS